VQNLSQAASLFTCWYNRTAPHHVRHSPVCNVSSCLAKGYEVCLKDSWERELRVLLTARCWQQHFARCTLSLLPCTWPLTRCTSHGAHSHCYPVRGRWPSVLPAVSNQTARRKHPSAVSIAPSCCRQWRHSGDCISHTELRTAPADWRLLPTWLSVLAVNWQQLNTVLTISYRRQDAFSTKLMSCRSFYLQVYVFHYHSPPLYT